MSTPAFHGQVSDDGQLLLDARGLFRTWLGKLKGKRVTVTVEAEAAPRTQDQHGYLFGCLYPFIAREICGYTLVESKKKATVDVLHDALMRRLGFMEDTPKAIGLDIRQSVAKWNRQQLSAYIEELRTWCVLEHGCVTPDAEPDRRKATKEAA